MDSILQLFKHKIEHNEKLTPKMQDILEASLFLFAEKGYSNTSTKDIAKAAQVAEGTIFKHFGSKENLLYASILPILSQSLEDMITLKVLHDPNKLNILSFEEVLRQVLPDRINLAGKNVKIWKIFLTEYLYQESMRDNLKTLIPKDLIQELNQIINLFKEKKEIVDWPNEEIIRLIISIVGGYILSKSLNYADKTNDTDETEHLIHFISAGLRA